MALGSESGQGIIEYILMLSIIAFGYVLLSVGLAKMNLAAKLTGLVTGPFSAAYRYGRVDAKGYDDGGPVNHPRADTSSNGNFRIFLNSGNQ